jgi:putative nucleotidyltransferase with HDIG domain
MNLARLTGAVRSASHARVHVERAPAALERTVPREVVSLARRLVDAGFPTFVVGGSVRDLLLDRPVRDWDLATAARPEEVQALCERVTPVAPEFGTVLVHLDQDGHGPYEVTTFRREGGYRDHRHPDAVVFTREVREDLVRRDFTVNALAYDPLEGTILDVAGGLHDLARRRLRAVGDPAVRFREDALRLLRAVRLAADLEFTLERRLRAAIPPLAGTAALLSPERVRDELLKILALPRPSVALRLLAETGLLAVLLPELDLTRDVTQNKYHAYDVFYHTLYSVDAAPADRPIVRLAALFHDIGKPATRVIRQGDATFYDHQLVGALVAERIMYRLRFPRADRERVIHLVRHHMFDYQPTWSNTALRRFIRRVGVDALADLFDLRLADYVGNGLRPGFPTYLDEMRARIDRELSQNSPLCRADLAVDGHDVMEILGLPPGPDVRRALDAMVETVLERPELNTRERLVDLLRSWRRSDLSPA